MRDRAKKGGRQINRRAFVQAGTATALHLANISLRLGRQVRWDAELRSLKVS